MSDKKKIGKSRRRLRTAEEKLRLVMESAQLSEVELGAFLRREGLHSTDLEAWRQDALSGFDVPSKKKRPRGVSAEAKQIKELERELRRKDKALAEVTALLVLKKKLEAILGEEDDGTHSRRGT